MRSCLLSLAVVLASLPAARTDAAEGGKHPNVLFLFTDDQRADTIAALGNPAIQTPNLDRLARAGFVFDNAYCMGSTMPAVCLPSRTMLLSGRSLYHLQNNKAPSFPRTLGEAGYVTYHHGKRSNTPLQIHKDFQHSHYLNDDQDRTSGFPGKPIADDAIAFLKEWKKDKPFFMYLAFANPHDPRVVNPEYRGKYDEAKLPLPRNYRPFHPFNNGELLVRDEKLAPWPRTPETVRKHLADYYGVVTYLDHQIGRILQALRETGEYDNTIIVFSSDHGLAVGSHGLFGKQNLYEDGMRVPLLFAGPGIPKGRSAAFAYLFDLYPTVCDLAGVKVPSGLDGRSLAPVIRGQTKGVRDTLFLAYRNVQRAVRQGDWKLIRYPQVDRTQLFDLRNDPHELKDLAADPAHAAKVKELLALLQMRQAEFGDTQPLTVPNPGKAEIDLSFFPKP
jgi:arylsulfatase A-like enzyme